MQHSDVLDEAHAIEARASRLMSLSTEVSSRIQEFEEWLNRLPAKLPIKVPIPDKEGNITDDGPKLAFHRGSGNKWVLFRVKGSSPRPLTSCTVQEKIHAIPAFDLLLKALIQEQQSREETLESALSALDRILPRQEGE